MFIILTATCCRVFLVNLNHARKTWFNLAYPNYPAFNWKEEREGELLTSGFDSFSLIIPYHNFWPG